MDLEQAITIKTLAKYHGLGNVIIGTLDDGTYTIAGMSVMNDDDEVLLYTASGKSFTQAYAFIKGVTRAELE